MFTGLVEEIGVIKQILPIGYGKKISIIANKIMNDIKIDDSISVNGVCLTVVSHTSNSFDVQAVEETISKSNLKELRVDQRVNLERAIRLSDRLGGHLVQGHVDCTGKISSIIEKTTSKLIWIEFPNEFDKYAVVKGSVCINGISLTIAQMEKSKLMVSVIPHTWAITNLCELKIHSSVNLEFDIIGKYIEKLISANNSNKILNNTNNSILSQFLQQPL